MAYFDYDTSLDFDAQEQEMLQQAARIKALRNMKGVEPEQVEGFKSAVTGATILAPQVKKPLLSSLTPLLADYTGDQMEKELNQQRSRINENQVKSYEELLGSFPTSRVEPLGPDEPTGSFVGDPSAAIAGMTDPVERARAEQAWRNQQSGNTRLVQPTRKELLDWTAKTQRGGPLVKSLGAKKAEDILLNEDERQAKMAMERTKFNENVRQFGIEEARKRLADDNQARYWSGQLAKDGSTAKGTQVFLRNEDDPDRPGQKRSIWRNTTTGEETPGSEMKEKEDASVVKDRLEAHNQYFRSRNILDEAETAKTLIEKSTGSKIGNWIDMQFSAFGSTTAGAAAIAALKPLDGLFLMAQPRFEGPQSDKDTATYSKASADIANPETPPEQRWAAYQTMARLQLKYAQQTEDRYGRPKGAPDSVYDRYKGMFATPTAKTKSGPLVKSNPEKPTGTTSDWTTPQGANGARGYAPPAPGSVDTKALEAAYLAEKDPGRKEMIAQQIMSANPAWRPETAGYSARRIK